MTAPAAQRGGVILAEALRVTALDATGVPVWGATSMIQTRNVVKLTFANEWQQGLDVTKTDGRGQVCLTHKTRDTAKRLNVTVEICDDDLLLKQLLVGGTLFTGTGGVIEGWQPPKVGEIGNPNGCSVELWAKRVMPGDIPNGYEHWAFPAVFLNEPDGTIGDAFMDMVFSGYATENANWGSGPLADFTHDSTALKQMMFAASLPTPLQDGYQTITAPSP